MRTREEIETDIKNKGREFYIDVTGINITKKLPNDEEYYFCLDMYDKKFYSWCYKIDFEILKLVNELIECCLQGRKINEK